MKQYIAEFIGTFTLTFAVSVSLSGQFPVPTPVIAALTLGLFVYSVGHISGTHINPAVTIGAWAIKKISGGEALRYVVAQSAGSLLALSILSAGGGSATLEMSNSMGTGGAEMLGTFFFTFGVASVIYGKAPGALSGVVVGGSLLLGIAIAALLGSNGVLNPAVALGIGSFGSMYVLGPIVGAVLGMQAYKYLVSGTDIVSSK